MSVKTENSCNTFDFSIPGRQVRILFGNVTKKLPLYISTGSIFYLSSLNLFLALFHKLVICFSKSPIILCIFCLFLIIIYAFYKTGMKLQENFFKKHNS